MLKAIILISSIFIAAAGAHAQFNKIKNAVTKSTDAKPQATPKSESAPVQARSDTKSSTSNDGSYTISGGLLDDVLLDYLNFNYDNRRIYIEQARAMGLSSDGTDVKVTMRIKAADGKTFATYESNAQAPKRNKSFLMQGFTGVDSTEQAINLPGAGDYQLEFSAGGKTFDIFPFSITPYTGDKGQSWFVMDGLWNDHALIDVSQDLIFHIWMRDMLEGTGKRKIDYGKYSARIVRENDGKVIGITNHPESTTLAPMRKWTHYKIIFAKGQNQSPISIYDITAQDGAYHVEFMHDGKLYGKYPFTVQAGKLKGASEFRGTPLETVEGDYTWAKRK